MTDDSAKDHKLQVAIERTLDHIARVTDGCGPAVVKAMNASVPFLEDYFLGEGTLADIPYIPRNKQGNQRYTAQSSDPVVKSVLRRQALGVARVEALHVPTVEEERQLDDDIMFLAHKNIALEKALGSPPIPRFPPPKLTRSMTAARLTELAVKAAEGLVDTSRIEVAPHPGSLKKLRSFLMHFPTKGALIVMVAMEFEGLTLWSSAVALAEIGKKPLPLLLFSDVSAEGDFAWPADMPTETRIACSFKIIATFAAQIG
ncbi:MAG: hypothetical protein WCS20_16220 [Alphaproteobacteria bacterium]